MNKGIAFDNLKKFNFLSTINFGTFGRQKPLHLDSGPDKKKILDLDPDSGSATLPPN